MSLKSPARRPFTAADERALMAMHAKGMKARQIAKELGRAKSVVTRRAQRLGLEFDSRRHVWSEGEIEALRRRYPHERTERIARDLGVAAHQVYAKAKKLGLKKTDAYLASPDACRLRRGDNVGAAYRFKKGQVPSNKGLRRPGWHRGRMRETQFKPGRPAHEARNYRPIGSTRIVYGNLERKVTDDPALYPAKRWRPVHRMVWEAAHGPVPQGHVVVFRPGMHTTEEAEITIDRLELLTHAENMRRNSYHTRYPKEIGLAIQLRGQIVRQINKRTRREEQDDRSA